MTDDPHQDQPVKTVGATLEDAERTMIMIHGRGATADSILRLSTHFPEDIAYLAPQAKNHEWYPESFLAPVEDNEPGRSSGLAVVDSLIDRAAQHGISTENVYLLGFSQGACLATEYAARNPAKYGGVFGLSGGLIGDTVDVYDYTGDLVETTVFLGCSDEDPHIPLERVNETAAVFEQLNAAVEKRIYEGMEHTINEDEIAFIQDCLR